MGTPVAISAGLADDLRRPVHVGAISGDPSFGGVLAGITFLLMGAGIVFGALDMAKDWEADAPAEGPRKLRA